MRNLNDTLADLANAVVRGDAPSPQITTAYPHYSADVAIEVYRNNYRGNLHDALAGAYPVILQLVGEDFFQLLARKFIEQYPSRSANLHHYGTELSDFIATFEPAQELGYLSDVAALEWACHVAYFAPDTTTLDLNKLAQIPPEEHQNLIFHIHPACQVVSSRFPVVAIWQAHQPGANSDFQIDLNSGPVIALVNRQNGKVKVGEIAGPEVDWLQSLQNRDPLGSATAATLERYPDFDLQAALLKLVNLSILTNFETGRPS